MRMGGEAVEEAGLCAPMVWNCKSAVNGRGTIAMRFATQLDNIRRYQNGLEQIGAARNRMKSTANDTKRDEAIRRR
jgi:hypothetical protein